MNRIVEGEKNGKPALRVDYTGSDGKRHQKFFKRHEVKAAEDYLAKATQESRQPTLSDLPSDITLAQYVDQWDPVAEKTLKPRTMDSYRETLRLHILPAFGSTPIRQIQRRKVKAYLSGKFATHARDSVRIMLATFRRVLSDAVEDQVIVANPLLGLGKRLKLSQKADQRSEDTVVKCFDRRQRDLFVAAAYKIVPWWAPMWHVQVLCGLRPGEAFALEEGDLDLEEHTGRIQRTLSDDGLHIGTCKGGRSRTVDLSAECVKVLREHISRRNKLKLKLGWKDMPKMLFCSHAGTYADPSTVRVAFKKVLKQARLPERSPHGLRHTFASLLLQSGESVYYVQKQLGHASIAETCDTYGRWLPHNRKGALDALDCGFTATGTDL